LLEWMKIPYTGSGVLASALGMDKARTKQLWKGVGLPTAPYCLLDDNTDYAVVIAELGLPLIIKPVHEGSSIGMSKVEQPEQLEPAYREASGHDAVVMAEAWITGREFTVVMLNEQALPVIRLEPPKDVAFCI
jgi:D-alanine-D-alanine ligase